MNANARPRVAAIVPVYNQRETVCEAIDSVLTQTRPVDEIVVVDDGSTDGSGDLVAERYGGRVRLIRQENRGAGAARNAAVRSSQAELVAFLDADDMWLPNRIEKQAAFMENRPHCMLSFTAHVHYDEETGETHVCNRSIRKRGFAGKVLLRGRNLPACDGVMVRREAFEAVGLFDESLRRCQDTDMWLRIIMQYGFEHIPEPLVWVRRGQHQTQPMDARFAGSDRYFAKHRHTFGRGLKGQFVWRHGYGAVLRQHVAYYLKAGRPDDARARLKTALRIWPFGQPLRTLKYLLELAMGGERYARLASAVRRVRTRLESSSVDAPVKESDS